MPKIVNILHLSDLHYSRKASRDISVVVEALLKDLSSGSGIGLRPDFVVFSGDLVQAADDEDAYLYLCDNVLDKISSSTGCPSTNFIFTSGNHDVQRLVVKENIYEQIGIAERCIGRDQLNGSYNKGNIAENCGRRFAHYNEFLALWSSHKTTHGNDFFQVHSFKDFDLDVIVLNTAWMSWGGLESRSDLRNLLFPEHALVEALQRSAATSRILVTHHPLGWLTEWCESDLHSAAKDNFICHLFGHMHEVKPTAATFLQGKLLQNQSGALYSGRGRYIGYSLIRIDLETRSTALHLRAYSDSRRDFHSAEQMINGGIFFPDEDSRRFWRQQSLLVNNTSLSSWILSTLLPAAERDLNEGVGDRKLCDVFVAPPLIKPAEFSNPVGDGEDLPAKQETEISFDELAMSNGSYVIYGRAEYGKTTLLKQTALRIMQEQSSLPRPSVPIIVDFSEISRGRNKIERLLRAGLYADLPSVSLHQLLSDGYVTIIVDNVVFADQIRFPFLAEFVKQFPKNRFLFTSSTNDTSRFTAFANPELAVVLQPVFIKPMTRSAMRNLVGKWDTKQRFKKTDILDRLVNEIVRINVPLTAVNGTILLTIYESQIDFRAVNRAVLIENFIEALLEKGSPESIERRTFDFTNQKHLLSHVAAQMAQTGNYILDYRALRLVVEEYLDSLGLANNAERILVTFTRARIFQTRADNRISFRYRAFLEYFIANQMHINSAFKAWILQEEHYLSFVNEILYYAGINRADLPLLDMVSHRFRNLYDDAVISLGWSPRLGALDTMQLPSNESDSETILSSYEKLVGAPPLSAAERDAILEGELPTDVENRQEVFRPRANDAGQKLILGLTLYSGLIRDLELISKNSKQKHLGFALDAWGVFLMASLQIVPQLAKFRKMRVNGVVYEVSMPRHFTEPEVARTLYLAMPTSLATLIWASLGTEKLEMQLTQPQLEETNEAGIITFLRTCLCADLKLGKWWSMFANFANRNRGSEYLMHVLLWKMRELHMMGDVPEEGVVEFRGVVSEVVANLRGGSRKDRLSTKSRQLQKLNKEDFVRRLRASREE